MFALYSIYKSLQTIYFEISNMHITVSLKLIYNPVVTEGPNLHKMDRNVMSGKGLNDSVNWLWTWNEQNGVLMAIPAAWPWVKHFNLQKLKCPHAYNLKEEDTSQLWHSKYVSQSSKQLI